MGCRFEQNDRRNLLFDSEQLKAEELLRNRYIHKVSGGESEIATPESIGPNRRPLSRWQQQVRA